MLNTGYQRFSFVDDHERVERDTRKMIHRVPWGYCHVMLLKLPNEPNWKIGQRG